jgi:hypothetical protein
MVYGRGADVVLDRVGLCFREIRSAKPITAMLKGMTAVAINTIRTRQQWRSFYRTLEGCASSAAVAKRSPARIDPYVLRIKGRPRVD